MVYTADDRVDVEWFGEINKLSETFCNLLVELIGFLYDHFVAFEIVKMEKRSHTWFHGDDNVGEMAPVTRNIIS